MRLRSSITWSGDECWMTGLTINRYEYFNFSGHTEQPPSTPHFRQNSSGRSFSLFLWESGKRILISICFCSELVQWFCCSSFLSKSHWEKVSRFTTNIGFLSDILQDLDKRWMDLQKCLQLAICNYKRKYLLKAILHGKHVTREKKKEICWNDLFM